MVTITLSADGAKNAANRLRDFLAADGISLKQTNAYEALAKTLGYANWNTLQALLSGTSPSELAENRSAKGSAKNGTAQYMMRVVSPTASSASSSRRPYGTTFHTTRRISTNLSVVTSSTAIGISRSRARKNNCWRARRDNHQKWRCFPKAKPSSS